MFRFPIRLFACGIAIVCAASARGEAWSEGFENGLGGAKSYYKDAPNAAIAIASDEPAEGTQFVRAVLPGKRKLEGLNVTATRLSGGRVASVSAKVRGKGEIWLCLISANGWLYSPRTLSLTDHWQTVSLEKALVVRDKSLSIHFLSREIQQGAVFEVDAIRVTLADRPTTYDARVGPWRLEAEDFTLRQADVTADESASGGRFVGSRQYGRLVHMPFPRTSRPVVVCVRVKPGSGGELYRLITTQGGNTQVLGTAHAKEKGAWQWVRFAPVYSGEAGDFFDVDFRQAKGAVEPVVVDSVVIGTHAGLEDAALDAAPGLFSRRPLVLISRAASRPELDGIADDPCWKNTVACTGFVGVGSLAPARAGTTVRMCYDNENLYALFVCEEPILGIARQRRHEFVAKVKSRDGDLFRDDSVVMLLDPTGTGNSALEFTVNGLGTLADARCKGPDLWESRDLGWNTSVEAAATMGDGAWSVEVAVPFADLSAKPPAVGDIWHACLGRIARARKENTSWNVSNRGLHEPRSLGALVFGGPAAGVILDAPAALQLGRNQVVATITPRKGQPAGVYVSSSIATRTGNAHSYRFAEALDAPEKVAAILEVDEEAELQVAHGVLDAATLAPLYLTPELSRTVRSTVAKVTLACDGPYELLLNEELLDRGESADAVEIEAPLQRGANLFALRLKSGTAAVTLEAPGLESQSVNWKVGSHDTPHATSPATDDSAWETAAKVGEHPKLGRVVGRVGTPVVLRHTLLWEKTRTWPTPSPAFHIARNTNQHLTFIADGLPKRKLIDWTIYLAVPPEFEILGSTGYYGNVDYQPSFLSTQLGEKTVGGRRMHVTRIAANKPVKAGRHYIFSVVNAFVRVREGFDGIDEKTAFVYWTEANDRTVVEPRQTIPVRLLPAVDGKQPKRIVWQLWGSFFANMNNHAMREATLATARQAGVNDLVGGDLWTSENAPRYGIRHTLGFNFQTWSLDMRPYLAEHPGERLVGQDGKANERLLCTTVLLGPSWHAVEAKLKEKIDAIGAHTLDYDFEYSPMTGPHSCYCRLCLAEFRDFARLAPDADLDPETIRARYEQAWVDFMSRRVSRLFRKFRDSIGRLAPGTTFSVYSGYQTAENPMRYGVNWAHVGDDEACDRAGCGYGRPSEAIEATRTALKGIPALFGTLLTPYNTRETNPPVPLTKARLLRRALDATGGVLVYARLPIDGRAWYAIGETTRLVAAHEDLFATGERTALPGCDAPRVQLLSDGKTTLVCVMNGSSKSLDLSVPLPLAAGGGHEFYGGRSVAAGQPVSCTLPPGEAEVFVLGK